MAYSFSQLEGIWIQAGGNRAIAPVMAAIALAESSGDPTRVNPTDNGGKQSSFGLWQISNGTHNPPASNWSNPVENAKLAIGKLHSQGLGAWGTYTSGAYKRYLGSAAPAAPPRGVQGKAQPPGAGSGSVSPGVGSGLSGKSAPSTGLWGWIQAVWTGAGVGASETQIGSEIGSAASLADQYGGLGAIAQAVVGLTAPITKIGNAIDWFFIPTHWVRIICGVGGLILVPYGLTTIVASEVGKGAGVPAAGMGTALGIAEVGIGAILLVVAFHNLPSTGPDAVKTPGELLGHLRSRVQADVSASTSPATATTAAGAS